jgi:hypothetical protein
MKSLLKNFFTSKFSANKVHILIACLPKSGSTFIASTIKNITEFNFIQFQPVRGTNDHNIDPSIFYSSLKVNTVTQLHLKPNALNKKLIKENNIKVVYLYRSILDSLRSFHNHILNENDQWFMFTASKDFKNWNIERQFDFIIDLILPWYINFITSWENEITYGSLEILPIDYDDFKKDNHQIINKILKFYGLDYDQAKVDLGLENSYQMKRKLRFNEKKDIYSFNEEQVKKVKKMISYYPHNSIKI